MSRYGHIITMVYGTPWAIRPETLQIITEMVRFRVEGGRLTQDDIEARIEAAGPRQRQQAQSGGSIAVLPLHGIIAPRAEMLAQTSSGGTGLDQYMGAFRAAMADPEIASVIMDIDSPGGQVTGVPEAAAEIRAAVKPVTAVANGMAASAAYWLGSQASEFVAAPSSQVGSIGVYLAHDDLSAAYEKAGIKTTLIAAGKYKTEGSDLEPLSDEARGYAQGIVDDFYAMFVNDVAKGRSVKASDVRGGFGEGRVLIAKKAATEGMIDRIDTLGGTIQRVAKAMPQRMAALAPGWTAEGEDESEPLLPHDLSEYLSKMAGNTPTGAYIVGEGEYIVGEHGPELFRPTENGKITDAYAFEAELRRRRAG